MSVSSWEQGPGFSYPHQPHVGAGGVCFFMGAEGQVSHQHQSHVGAGGICFFMGAGARVSQISISHI